MSSNITNSSKVFVGYVDLVNEIRTSLMITGKSIIIIAVVGTLINLWFIMAILRSREMRSRFRNKIICSTFVAHLLDTTVVFPITVSLNTGFIRYTCNFMAAIQNLRLIQDFIANWLIVILLVVFIAQIQDFDPKSRLSPKAVTGGTIGLLVLPWFASTTLVPVIMHSFRPPWASAECFLPTMDSYQVFKSIDTAVPILLATLLLVVAAVLRYKSFTQRSLSDSMQTELVSRGPGIDNISAYVAAVTVFTLCDLVLLITACGLEKFLKYGFLQWFKLTLTAGAISDVRTILMPLTWLLLPDVRQLIKTWRPWHCPSPGIDLTFTYRKDEN